MAYGLPIPNDSLPGEQKSNNTWFTNVNTILYIQRKGPNSLRNKVPVQVFFNVG